MTYLTILAGIALLVVGGELLVRYSARLAVSAGISPLVAGLTVVAYGTSAPEMISSVYGRLAGQGSLAVGNNVGSNIFNVFFILGVSAVVAPLIVHSKLLKFEVPAVVVVSLGTVGFAYSGTIAKWEALVLLVGLVAYTVWVVVESRSEGADVVDEYADGVPGEGEDSTQWAVSVGLVAVGLGLLIVGGRMFVNGAVEIAEVVGVTETVIGLTVVAAGTSLPELVTSILATIRGQTDIAVGNVVGSNLFNLLGVLGLTGILGSGGLAVPPEILQFDLLVMLATAVVCLPVMFTGSRIDRWEGGVFVLYYLGYVMYLVLETTGHVATQTFVDATLWFVLPLSLLTLAVVGYREIRRARDG